MACVLADLICLTRQTGDAMIALAAQRTGIAPENIVWAASHTHTGPYTIPLYRQAKNINKKWLNSLPEKFARAITLAHTARRPARLSRERDYCNAMVHNRRLKYKDGREINTWLLHSGEEQVQCLGSAAPIDPEVGILCFDDEQGAPIAVLWHYTLHTNSNFGPRFSADYPGVVAGRLRERFGPATVSIFMPGACADINRALPSALTAQGYRVIGDELADIIIKRLEQRKPRSGAITLGVLKKEITVPCRDFSVDQEERLKNSQWSPKNLETFRQQLQYMRRAGKREEQTIIQAWRIGEIGFVSLPGELFVEWGLKIKARSPFPWTYPLELGGDCLGYLVTEQAWIAGGYESLISCYTRTSFAGVAQMTDMALKMLAQLWQTK